MILPTATQGKELLDNATTVVATSAVTSPVWLPWLHTASQVAATMAPLLGVIWLIVQIWSKVIETLRKGKQDG